MRSRLTSITSLTSNDSGNTEPTVPNNTTSDGEGVSSSNPSANGSSVNLVGAVRRRSINLRQRKLPDGGGTTADSKLNLLSPKSSLKKLPTADGQELLMPSDVLSASGAGSNFNSPIHSPSASPRGGHTPRSAALLLLAKGNRIAEKEEEEEEEDLQLWVEIPNDVYLFIEALLAHLLAPLGIPYLLTVGGRRPRQRVLFPLGTLWLCAPLLWVLAGGVVVAAVMIMTEPSWSKDVYLQSDPTRDFVPVGEGALSLSLYFLFLFVAALSSSHGFEVPESREHSPFRKDYIITTAAATNPMEASQLSQASHQSSEDDWIAKQKKMQLKLAKNNSSLKKKMFIPYDEVLLDEIPPIDTEVTLLYPCDAFFEPNRDFEYTLAEAKEQTARVSAMHAVLGGAGNGVAPLRQDGFAGFAFAIGETVKRTAVEPNEEFDFGGSVGVLLEGATAEIASRKWGPNLEELYIVDGGDDSRWYALTEHFSSYRKVPKDESYDVAVGSEAYFQSMSHRNRLYRYRRGNGNCHSNKDGVPSPIHPLLQILHIFLALLVSATPILVRWFTGHALQGQGHIAEWILVCSSFCLTFFCSIGFFTILRATRISFANYHSIAYAFTTVSFTPHVNRWFPILNMLEPINVEAWYFLRLHVVECSKVAFNNRMISMLLFGIFTVVWAVYSIFFVALAPDPSKVYFPGWLACANLLLLIFATKLLVVMYHAVSVNGLFASHEGKLSLTKVMTNEELASNVESRSKQEIGTLLDVQAVLADVMFVIHNSPLPVQPLGLVLRSWVGHLYALLQLLTLVTLGLLISSSYLLRDRWELVDGSSLI